MRESSENDICAWLVCFGDFVLRSVRCYSLVLEEGKKIFTNDPSFFFFFCIYKDICVCKQVAYVPPFQIYIAAFLLYFFWYRIEADVQRMVESFFFQE